MSTQPLKRYDSPASALLTACLSTYFFLAPIAGWAYSVVSGSKASTDAAVAVLKKGGSAADAMVAAITTQNVWQPFFMGIGGGGLAVVSQNGRVQFFDGREEAPASATPTMFLSEKFEGGKIPYYPERVTGANPVGIPGTVALLGTLHKRFGKLPWKQLTAQAALEAKNGIVVSKHFSNILVDEFERLTQFPYSKLLFSGPDGGPQAVGLSLKNIDLSRTFEQLGAEGWQSFYTGSLGRSWLSAAQRLGVKINQNDLARYAVREAKPLQFNSFGLSYYSAQLPSAGSTVLAGYMRFLEYYYKSHTVPAALSVERFIITLETLRFYQKLRDENLADVGYAKFDPQTWIGSAKEKAFWLEISNAIDTKTKQLKERVLEGRRTPDIFESVSSLVSGLRKETPSGESPKNHTAHLAIIDDRGLAISLTDTIEQHFGSALAVPGFGFLLNNELSDFTADTDHPNSPKAGKRPRSNMSPTLIFDSKKKLLGAVGCAGGTRIPATIAQFLDTYFVHNLSALEASAFPRAYFINASETIVIENSMPNFIELGLKQVGYKVERGEAESVLMTAIRRKAANDFTAVSEPPS
jgi:gamma-glutamyltranspeptidase/glutathione hydrolase